MPRTTHLAAGACLAALAMVAGPAAGAAAADDGDLDWFFTEALGGAGVDSYADFGNLFDGDFPLVCDANNDGDEPALWNDGTFIMEGGDVVVRFGRATDYPLCGDWDGDGVDTPGVVRGNQFILASANVDGGGGATAFGFGRVDDFPLVGDWDGDGDDTIGLARGNRYIVASANVSGGGTLASSTWGRDTDFPVAGDWDGDGHDSLALQRNNTFIVSNSTIGTTVTAARSFGFGRASDYPVAGTLEGDTRGSVGLVRIEFS